MPPSKLVEWLGPFSLRSTNTGLFFVSVSNNVVQCWCLRNLNNFNFSRLSFFFCFPFESQKQNRMVQLPDGDNIHLVATECAKKKKIRKEMKDQQQQKQRWKIIMLWGSICMIISLCRVVTINNTKTSFSSFWYNATQHKIETCGSGT